MSGGGSSGMRQSFWTRGLRAVLAFNAAYLSVAVAAALATGNAEFVFYILVMVVLMAIVAGMHHRVHLSPAVLWGLSVWGLAHMAGGLCPAPASWPIDGTIRVLYSVWIIPGWLKYDHVVHAYGFGVTTLLCWEGLRSMLAGDRPEEERGRIRPTAGMATLCAAAAMGFGALNEVIEFAATLLAPETNVGGYVNTGWDLVSNLVGSAVVAVGIWFRGRRD